MKQNVKKNEKGFTLIELIIVIAIMGILAAVLVPSFSKMTAKARISTDFRTVQVLQTQAGLYEAEKSKFPGIGIKNDWVTEDTSDAKTNAEQAVSVLIKGGYIESKNTDSGASIEKQVGIQSGAKLVYIKDATTGNYEFKLNKSKASSLVQTLFGDVTGSDKKLVVDDTTATEEE